MSYLADDSAAIKARLEELMAEKQLALTGSSAPVQVEAPKDIDWTSMYGVYATPSGVNDAAREYMAGTFNLPDLRGRVKPT
jgi:hypothetical protein